MSQIATKAVSTLEIVRRPGFRRGLSDAARGEPLREEPSPDWSYERGRMLWIWLLVQAEALADTYDGRARQLDRAFDDGAVL